MRALALLLLALPASAGEHPYFEAFPGSRLEKNDVKQLDEYELPVGQLNSGRYVQTSDLEGKLTVLHYGDPPQRSTLELMRTYEAALKQKGFTPIYSCKGRQCGSGCLSDKALGHFCVDEDHRFLAAKRPGGDAYAAVLLTGGETRVAIVETAAGSAPAPSAPATTPAATEAPAPKSSGRAPDEVETGIVKGLNSFGLHAKSGTSGDIVVEGKVTTAPLETSGDKRWKWARTSVTVSIKDGRSGATIARFDATDRQASADYNEAVRRSYVELGKKVSEQVKEAITAYFENQ